MKEFKMRSNPWRVFVWMCMLAMVVGMAMGNIAMTCSPSASSTASAGGGDASSTTSPLVCNPVNITNPDGSVTVTMVCTPGPATTASASGGKAQTGAKVN